MLDCCGSACPHSDWRVPRSKGFAIDLREGRVFHTQIVITPPSKVGKRYLANYSLLLVQLKDDQTLSDPRKSHLFAFSLKEPKKRPADSWSKDRLWDLIERGSYTDLPDPKYSIIWIEYPGLKPGESQPKTIQITNAPPHSIISRWTLGGSSLERKEVNGFQSETTNQSTPLEQSGRRLLSVGKAISGGRLQSDSRSSRRRLIPTSLLESHGKFRLSRFSPSPRNISRSADRDKSSEIDRLTTNNMVKKRTIDLNSSARDSIFSSKLKQKPTHDRNVSNIQGNITQSSTRNTPALFLRGKRPITGIKESSFLKPKAQPTQN